VRAAKQAAQPVVHALGWGIAQTLQYLLAAIAHFAFFFLRFFGLSSLMKDRSKPDIETMIMGASSASVLDDHIWCRH
jgi:putative Mn2+ efflux pump MntP